MSEIHNPLLAVFLSEHDHPCPQCEYNLRNLVGNRCPECGEELVLQINIAQPRQRLLLTGLIGLAAGAGLNGLLLVFGCIELLRYPAAFADRTFWITNIVGFAVQGAAIVAWLVLWRWIRRRTTTGRLLLATACWLLTLGNLLVFSFYVR